MSTNFVFAPERDWKTEGDQKGMRESSTLACLDLGKLFLYKVKAFFSSPQKRLQGLESKKIVTLSLIDPRKMKHHFNLHISEKFKSKICSYFWACLIPLEASMGEIFLLIVISFYHCSLYFPVLSHSCS